jgi:hypothetical protein
MDKIFNTELQFSAAKNHLKVVLTFFMYTSECVQSVSNTGSHPTLAPDRELKTTETDWRYGLSQMTCLLTGPTNRSRTLSTHRTSFPSTDGRDQTHPTSARDLHSPTMDVIWYSRPDLLRCPNARRLRHLRPPRRWRFCFQDLISPMHPVHLDPNGSGL